MLFEVAIVWQNFKSSDRIRRAKHEKNYTVILNSTIQDGRLSWKARGLHHYILSLPDDWDICIAHRSEQSINDGIAMFLRVVLRIYFCNLEK